MTTTFVHAECYLERGTSIKGELGRMIRRLRDCHFLPFI